MGRRGGGGFSRSSSSSRSRAPARPAPRSTSRTTPAPVQQQPAQLPAQQTGGGGFLSNVAGGIFSGLTFGTGSAVAHRAMDGIMGPRTVEHVHTGQEQQQQPLMQQPDPQNAMQQYNNAPPMGAYPTQHTQQPVEGPCASQILSFKQCMDLNNNDIMTCTPFMEQLQQCQRQ